MATIWSTFYTILSILFIGFSIEYNIFLCDMLLSSYSDKREIKQACKVSFSSPNVNAHIYGEIGQFVFSNSTFDSVLNIQNKQLVS